MTATRGQSERGFPRAPWGRFPLSELVVLLALACGIAGFAQLGTARGAWLIGAAFTLGCVAGFELALREHLAGHRDRSVLLAAAVAAVSSGVALAAGLALAPAAMVAGVTGAAALVPLRRARRR
jgi:hypothetical protein